MDVDHETLGKNVHDWRPNGQTWTEHPVHDVDVDEVDPGFT